MTDKPLFSDILITHEHEEKLRTESIVLIRADRGTVQLLGISSLHNSSLFHHHCRVVDAPVRNQMRTSRNSSANNEKTP